MCCPYSSITFINECKYICLVFHLKPVENWVIWVGLLGCNILGFEALGMGLRTCPKVHFLRKNLHLYGKTNEELTVLVKRAWGHVPHRKFRQTFSSDHTRLALATPIASGPIICCRLFRLCCGSDKLEHTSKSFLCISAKRPILIWSLTCWTCLLERFENSKVVEFLKLYYVIKYPANGNCKNKNVISYVTVKYKRFKHETVERCSNVNEIMAMQGFEMGRIGLVIFG